MRPGIDECSTPGARWRLASRRHLAHSSIRACGEPFYEDFAGAPAKSHGVRSLFLLDATHRTVCKMTVVKAGATATRSHKGVSYYFCNPGCPDTFEHNPGRVTSTLSTKTSADLR